MQGSEIAPRRARPSTKLRMHGYEEFHSWWSNRTNSVLLRLRCHHEAHEGHEDSEIITFQFLNFVLFATFVVKCPF